MSLLLNDNNVLPFLRNGKPAGWYQEVSASRYVIYDLEFTRIIAHNFNKAHVTVYADVAFEDETDDSSDAIWAALLEEYGSVEAIVEEILRK